MLRLIEDVGRAVDVAGVALIIAGGLWATAALLRRTAAHATGVDSYRLYRHDLGRAILLGLEVLVAADIIRTVAVSPSLRSVAVLGGIVLIRTFLSISLETEINGRWPWQRLPREQ